MKSHGQGLMAHFLSHTKEALCSLSFDPRRGTKGVALTTGSVVDPYIKPIVQGVICLRG